MGAVPMTSAAKPHGDGARADDVTHRRLADVGWLDLSRAGELRILRKSEHWLRKQAAQIEIKPRAGRAVMAPSAQRLKQSVAREVGHQVAGEPTDRAEGRGAGARGAGPSFVVIAVANDTDAITPRERIVEEPLERAPGGMHLDRALQTAVMGAGDVGIAAADVGNDNGVLALQFAKQLICRVDRRGRRLPLDQNV